MNKNKIFIGDNLEIMNSSLLEPYKNKIKLIYIDPPYNTKTNKSYNDKKTDEEWIKFMKKRLEKAKEFLTKDGCIFISIDDNEYAELKVLCDNIFEKKNHIGTFITYQSLRSNSKLINTIHEYILCYALNKEKVKEFKILRYDIEEEKIIIDEVNKKIREIFKKEGQEKAQKELNKVIKSVCEKYNISWLKNYNLIDENGEIYFAMDLSTPSKPRQVDIPSINLKLEPLKTRGWSSDEKFIDLHNRKLLVFKDNRPYEKHYLKNACNNVISILKFFSRNGTNALKKMGLYNLFDTPKPVEMIKFLIKIATNEEDYIMDFFAGSGTTAQAVYEVNSENNRNNKYILIQTKEPINEKSPAYEVCKEKNIMPFVSEAMKYRIETFLKINNKKIDFDFIGD